MSNHIFSTIDHDQLTNVTGGASPSSAVLDKLNGRFGSQGAVSFVGHPKFTSAGNGMEHASGKFDVNALSGGDTRRSFTANVNDSTHKVTGLHTDLLGFPN